MSENPPKPLSEGKQRKLARTQAKEGNFHERTKASLAEAKGALDRAKYVERGVIDRFVLGTRGGKYDEAVHNAAPVDETLSVPEKGSKRRKAARAYSRAHDLSGQIKKEKKRLENLAEQTKELERGSVSRLILGTRGKKYNRALYKEAETGQEIQKALTEVEKDRLSFRPPTPRKIIDITPPVTEEELPRRTRPYVQPRQPSETESSSDVFVGRQDGTERLATEEQEPDFSAEAHMGRIADRVATAEEALTNNEREALAATRRMVRAEERGFVDDVARTGKTGKNIFWTRIGSIIKGLSIPLTLILAAVGGKAAVDEYNSRPVASRSVGEEGTNPDLSAQAQASPSAPAEVVSFEEVDAPIVDGVGGGEDETLSQEERAEILRQYPDGNEPSGAEEARLRAQAAAQEPVRGVEPPSAPE